MATLFTTDGGTQVVEPANGKSFTLDEMYTLIGADIVEIHPVKGRGVNLVMDEEGKLRRKPVNVKATLLWEEKYGVGSDIIVGDVLLTGPGELRSR